MPVTRYHEALNSIPAPGTGSGCHQNLMRVANFGACVMGISIDQVFDDIRANIPYGNRKVTDREIKDTVTKAFNERRNGNFTPRPRPKPVVNDGKKSLQNIIDQAKITDEADLWESSPIRLLDDPLHDSILFLKTLYKSDERIFIGDRIQPGIMGQTIRAVPDWIDYFKNRGKTAPFIVLNPLTGQPALTKSRDKETLRGDGNIASYKYCMAEFDNLGREDQIKFWSAVKLPIVALIDSGNKSIHGIIRSIKTGRKWRHPKIGIAQIKQRLYERILKPLGVDGACSNPARLSRLPGHFRSEKKFNAADFVAEF